MDSEQIDYLFNTKYEDEFLTFEKVENKLTNRADLHAMLVLDKLVPGNGDILGGAEHDEIYFSIDEEEFIQVATEEVILELVRCGVRWSDDGLCMFV